MKDSCVWLYCVIYKNSLLHGEYLAGHKMESTVLQRLPLQCGKHVADRRQTVMGARGHVLLTPLQRLPATVFILKYIKNGRLTGLVTSYVETAFYNKLLKER